jgi:hypothetical protein
LISLIIPNSVNKISECAFCGCTSLRRVDILDCAELSIEEGAFDCEIAEIHCHGTNNIASMDIDTKAFNKKLFKSTILYVPSGVEEEYKQHPVWGRFKNIKPE